MMKFIWILMSDALTSASEEEIAEKKNERIDKEWQEKTRKFAQFLSKSPWSERVETVFVGFLIEISKEEYRKKIKNETKYEFDSQLFHRDGFIIF